MKAGDLVQFPDPRPGNKAKKVTAIVIRVSADPDRVALFMDRQGAVWPKYRDAVQVCGAIIRSKQHLDRESAKIRQEIEDLAKSEYGKEKIIQAREMLAGHRPEAPEGPARRNRTTAAADVPLRLATTELGEHPRGLEKYLAMRDARPDPADLDLEAHEVRALDALRIRNPRYYRTYMALVEQRRSLDWLAAAEEISYAAARQLSVRARRAYQIEAKKVEAAA